MEFAFNAFVTLFVVVDPLGLAPIFAALTRGFSEKQKRESAIRGTLLGALILFLFALAGDVLLEASASDFRLSGSPAACCSFSLSRHGLRQAFGDARHERARTGGGVLPAGHLRLPPCHTASGRPRGHYHGPPLYGRQQPGQVALFIAVLFVILLLTLSSLLLAPRVMRLFGETGANVLSRVLGVLLAALAVQFVIDGLQASIT